MLRKTDCVAFHPSIRAKFCWCLGYELTTINIWSNLEKATSWHLRNLILVYVLLNHVLILRSQVQFPTEPIYYNALTSIYSLIDKLLYHVQDVIMSFLQMATLSSSLLIILELIDSRIFSRLVFWSKTQLNILDTQEGVIVL